MLHVLERVEKNTGRAVLRSMFEARKRVFVDLLGWDVPVLDGRFEIDQFDDAHATYIILTAPDGSHLASARLLPSLRPHILGDLYPELCVGAVPRGPAIAEITRFCLDRSLNARERRQARNRLVSAIADYGLASGISLFTGVAELPWLQQILAFGWRCRPLGLPLSIGGSLLGALAIEIDADTAPLLAQAGIYCGDSVVTEMRDAA